MRAPVDALPWSDTVCVCACRRYASVLGSYVDVSSNHLTVPLSPLLGSASLAYVMLCTCSALPSRLLILCCCRGCAATLTRTPTT